VGKNNKARRAAKAKTRLRARGRSSGWSGTTAGGGGGEFFASQDEVAAFLWVRSARTLGSDDYRGPEWRRLTVMPRKVVDRTFETLIADHIDLLYANGWLPAELARQGRLPGVGVAWGRLLARAIASDHARRRASTLDSAWIAHVASLDLPAENGAPGWVDTWRQTEQLEHEASLELMLAGYASLMQLPVLHLLIPAPGRNGERPRPLEVGVRRGVAMNPVLDKVRNLLAKAESSTFEAEASALTAKAHELITRHAIDKALLDEHSSSAQTPVETRVPIDPPYADAKSLLLQTVAETGRCRTVFMPGISMSTLVGYPEDVDAVETLFTSLLVQAQHALNAAAKSAPPGTRMRSRSYRAGFLVAYTHRIGERLRRALDHTVDEMSREIGRDLLPVLADRSDDVSGYLADRFGDLVSSPVRGGGDPAGWAGGRLAADQAQLAFGELEDLV
jgi:hypothetical protein